MFLSVIIPAYNEEKRLPKTLACVEDFLRRQNYESEILVVNDGSKDDTAEIMKVLMKELTTAEKSRGSKFKLRLLDNEENHGKGYVVRKGMLEATGEYRLFMDADGSTPITEVEKLLSEAKIGDGYDVIIGSRRITGAVIMNEQPWHRLVLGRIFRGMVDSILPLGVIDTQNGFKLFSAKSATNIFAHQIIFGWAFDVEVLALAKKLSYKVKEVPIVWTDDDRSRVTLRGMVTMLYEVIKIRMRMGC